MSLAYVDSSCFVSIAFDEPGAAQLLARLSRYDKLISSNLLEAEYRASLARENVVGRVRNLLSWVTWVHPKRRLTRELDQILEVCRPPKGSDLWHLACALYLRNDWKLQGFSFLSLDDQQSKGAQALGMKGL